MKLPDTLVLLLGILLVFTVLTWIVPAGEFERTEVNGRNVVVPNSYHEIEANPANGFQFLLAPIKGFISSAQIIVFIFVVAGAFGIINKTNAINLGLQSVVEKSKQNPQRKAIIIPILVFLFSLAGATFGMSEEVLVFVLITLPLSFSLGYDSLVGLSIPFIGAGAGFAGAFLNPFTVGIAQGIAELPPFSGWEYRIVVWLLFTLVAIIFLMIYARKIEKNPQKSIMYEIDQKSKYRNVETDASNFSGKHRIIIIVFLLGLVALIVGVNKFDWYINEIAALFIVLGVISAIIARLKMQETVDSFVHGASEMVKVCFVIALAKGVLIIASDGKIIDTILYAMSSVVEDYPRAISIQLMFYSQSFLNFFLPSGSGQAALTMPIMSPLGRFNWDFPTNHGTWLSNWAMDFPT